MKTRIIITIKIIRNLIKKVVFILKTIINNSFSIKSNNSKDISIILLSSITFDLNN